MPAKVYNIVLSDVIGDRIDSIASGPAAPDGTTAEQAKYIVEKYGITMTEQMRSLLEQETPKAVENVETKVIGSVNQLCRSAAKPARSLAMSLLS